MLLEYGLTRLSITLFLSLCHNSLYTFRLQNFLYVQCGSLVNYQLMFEFHKIKSDKMVVRLDNKFSDLILIRLKTRCDYHHGAKFLCYRIAYRVNVYNFH